MPQRPVAQHLAQVEAVAVEIDVDQVGFAGLIMEPPAKLGAAHLAEHVCELDLSIADRGEGRAGEISDRLARHPAITGRPAREGPQARPVDLHGAREQGSEIAVPQAARDGNAIAAGKRGLQALDGDAAIVAPKRHVEAAGEIAAETRLLDVERERALADLRRLFEHPLGGHVEHGCGRRLLLIARGAEQRIEIDPARGQLAFGLVGRPEVEIEAALQDLRTPGGVNRQIEVGHRRAVGRGFERTLQLHERGRVARAARRRRILRRFRLRDFRLRRFGLKSGVRFRLGVRVGQRIEIGHAHEDGAVIDGGRAEPRDRTVELVGRGAVGIAHGGLHAELARLIHGPGGEANGLTAAFVVVFGGDFVGTGERGRARLAVDVGEHEFQHAVLDDLDRAAAHAHGVEQHVLRREGHGHARPSHIAPVPGAVGGEFEAQRGIDDGELMRFDRAGQKRPHVDLRLERLRLEERLLQAAVLVRHSDVVEFQLRRRQDDEMDLAANLDLAAEQLAGLLLEGGAVVVPVDEERCGEQSAQHQNQQRGQCEQKRVHRYLCLRLGCGRIIPAQSDKDASRFRRARRLIMLPQKSCQD